MFGIYIHIECLFVFHCGFIVFYLILFLTKPIWILYLSMANKIICSFIFL